MGSSSRIVKIECNVFEVFFDFSKF